MMNVQEFVNELTKYRKLVEEVKYLEVEGYPEHLIKADRDAVHNQAVRIVSIYSKLLGEYDGLKANMAVKAG